jgi:glutamate transport system substrate-binding protein
MRMRRLRVAAATAAVALALTACGDKGPDTAAAPATTATATASPSTSADSGPSLVARIKQSGKLVIGVKFDQPGVGQKDPATGKLSGFDIEVAKLIGAALGIKEQDIEFKETVSGNRETFISTGTVDLVVASYSITDARRAVVSQAGPYYVTGQQLLVRKDDSSITGPDSLKDKKVCSVTGSTSIKTVQEKYGAAPAPFSTYTECVTQLLNKTVDAVTTDGAILLGYASRQPEKLKVVGDPFSTERYGIGFKHGDTDTCSALRDALAKIFGDGSWAKAFADTLGKAGVSTPSAPTVDSTC